MYQENRFFTHRIFCPDNTEIQLTKNICIALVLNGSGQLQQNGRIVRFNAGDLYFFPSDTLYTRTCSSGTSIYEIHILPYYYETIFPDLSSISLRHFHISENPGDERNDVVYQRLCGFVNSWLKNDNPDILNILSRLNDLVSVILKYFRNTDPVINNAQNNYIQDRIRKIIYYISQNYRNRISVSDISRYLGLNPQYFSTFFTKYFGQSFVEFLNDYRVNSALDVLSCTDTPITQVALDCGFGTYRSFNNAFKKSFGINPSEFKAKDMSGSGHDSMDPDQISEEKLFDFLQKYSPDSVKGPASSGMVKQYLDLDLSRLPVVSRTIQIKAINIGSAYYLLQDKIYDNLKKAAKECHFTHVHFSDLFCDMLSVYTESSPGVPVFFWDNINEILDRITAIGLYPFIEIGFMPRELAASKDTLGYGYHPCIGLPKSISRWKDLIRSFLDNITHMYSEDTLNNWLFDFWNSANIQSSEGFWSGTKESFFQLYFETYAVFREYSLERLLGTPNFSIPTGFEWYEDFLRACTERNTHPGFLSMHAYSCPDNLEHFEGIMPLPPTTLNYLSLTDTDNIQNSVLHLKELLKTAGFPNMPIIFSEWNFTFFPSDLIRDTAFMATYIIDTWARMFSQVRGITFSSLTDIIEHARPSTLIFPGFQGLLGKDSLPKPAYYAFLLLSKLDMDIILNERSCIISRGKDRWHILFYNVCQYNAEQQTEEEYISDEFRYNVFKNAEYINMSCAFSLPSGTYQITTYQINRQYGSPYDTWLDMGCPKPLNHETIQALFHASYPKIHYERKSINRLININVVLEPHSIILYEIVSQPHV